MLTFGVYCSPQKSYIVTGGLGGFGLAVCEFLNAYGAKNIVVTSKRGIRDGNQTTHLIELFKHNIKVKQLIPPIKSPAVTIHVALVPPKFKCLVSSVFVYGIENSRF